MMEQYQRCEDSTSTMPDPRPSRATLLACLLLLGCATTDASTGANARNGPVQVHGALRSMMHAGETGTTVTLDELLPNPILYAVGALTDLAGEITIIDGKAYLSFPDDGTDHGRTEVSPRSNAAATLLVTAEVPAWRHMVTASPIPFEDIGDAIAGLAAEAGLDPESRFVFLVRGEVEDLDWHVIDGSRLADGSATHEDHLAASIRGRLPRASATLVGFHSTRDQGIFTHMDATTHIHCVLHEPLASGHVDHVTIPAGTTIAFPSRGNTRPDRD